MQLGDYSIYTMELKEVFSSSHKEITSIDDVRIGSIVKSVLGFELPISAIQDDYITLTLKEGYVSNNANGDIVVSDMKFRAHYTTFKLVKK